MQIFIGKAILAGVFVSLIFVISGGDMVCIDPWNGSDTPIGKPLSHPLPIPPGLHSIRPIFSRIHPIYASSLSRLVFL